MTEQRLRDFIKEELKSIKKEVKEGINGYSPVDLGDIDAANDAIWDDFSWDFGGAAAEYYNWMSEEDQDKLNDLIDYADDKKGLKELTNMLMKYKNPLRGYGLKSKESIENFAKWYSPNSWELSESVLIKEGFSTWEVEFGRGKVGGVDYAKAGKVSVKARNTVEAIKKAVKQVGNADDWMAVDIENLKKI